jgi:hypothetical protein
MKPDSHYKINGKSYPVFKAPILKKDIESMILNDIGTFIINDNGKLKAYNTHNNLPQQFSLFKDLPSITTTNILKAGLFSVVALWVYRLGTYRPNLNPFRVDKDHIKNLEKKYRDLNNLRYNGTKKKGTMGENKEAEFKSSATLPNGWTIETPTRN